jgi:hypothetical protein
VKKALLGSVLWLTLLVGLGFADFESDVIDLVNAERQAEGLHPLDYDARLTTAARQHSQDMAQQNYFGHDSLDGRKFYERILDAGYDYSTCGENIAAGYGSPEAVVNAWMNSSGHRANILNTNFCDIGVGYVNVPGSAYQYYWTQDFGRRPGVDACPSELEYEITAGSGPGGSISPAGAISVTGGGDATFTVIPDAGYSVADVLVDGVSVGILLQYTFADVRSNHSIAASFATNTESPIADAGDDQRVALGDGVTLNASRSQDPNDAIVSYRWIQVEGPTVTLSAADRVQATFVPTPTLIGESLMFQVTVTDSGGLEDTDSVEVTVESNGISGFPDDVITFYSASGRPVGIRVESGGALTWLKAIDLGDNRIADRTHMPENLIYGLIEFTLRTDHSGGTVQLSVFLPESIPAAHKWYKYGTDNGWFDYSAHTVVNDTRDQIRITLADEGAGDDDGQQDGIIIDPSGLGTAAAAMTDSGGAGGSGCFIGAAGKATMPFRVPAILLIGWGIISAGFRFRCHRYRRRRR